MDWTDFDADGQATIMLSLLTRHGRATPLLWLAVDASTLKNRRNEYEYQALVRLADAQPADIKVCIVADRGSGDQKLYRVLTEELKFDYVIRFRGNITVTTTADETRTAAAFVGPRGRARVLRGAFVTADRYPVGTVLCVQDKEMKQAWCLAASSTSATSKALMRLCMLYELIPTMPEVRLLPLIERFTTMLAELPVFADTLSAIAKPACVITLVAEPRS